MQTTHQSIFSNSRSMSAVADQSVGLVVTSPPYPMIEMWDEIFAQQDPAIRPLLDASDGYGAYSAMHQLLADVWRECYRVLQDGCFLCINIGDATRKVGDKFRLYSSHSRITEICEAIGFESLPMILWRKQTNAPNKFMGSGMLPGGAYVTLEHEYILILRKQAKRDFVSQAAKELRQQSAYFWEERNLWFSDLWDFKGTRQAVTKTGTRERSAAYPFELAYRLINMYSLGGETILDPFMGTGTTTLAALCAGRNSIGYDIDPAILDLPAMASDTLRTELNQVVHERLERHRAFITDYTERKGPPKYLNEHHQMPVITNQESKLLLQQIDAIHWNGLQLLAQHSPIKSGAFLP
jgi:modification methylase